MKHRIVIILSFLLVIFSTGCKKVIIQSDDDISILYKTVCGWCVGEESVTITPTTIKYERTIFCGPDRGPQTTSKSISAERWDSIWSSFDFDAFKTLDYDVCNVCADGCDEIIKITNYCDTHEIRFSPGQEIEGIEGLKQILTEIQSEFNSQN